MFNFHTSVVRRSNLSCLTDCTKYASAAALIHRQQTFNRLTQTKVSGIYRNKLIVTYTYMYWALMKREALLTIYANLKLAIKYIFLTFLSRDPVARGGKL